MPPSTTKLAPVTKEDSSEARNTTASAISRASPKRPSGMCTMIYGERETAVPLGSDFRHGATYTLDVNGTRQRFFGDGP